MSPAGLDLAERLLSYDPAQRVTAVDALEAPYFKQEHPRAALPAGYVFDVDYIIYEVLMKTMQAGKSRRRVARTGNEAREGQEAKENGAYYAMRYYNEQMQTNAIVCAAQFQGNRMNYQTAAEANFTRFFSVKCCTMDSTWRR